METRTDRIRKLCKINCTCMHRAIKVEFGNKHIECSKQNLNFDILNIYVASKIILLDNKSYIRIAHIFFGQH